MAAYFEKVLEQTNDNIKTEDINMSKVVKNNTINNTITNQSFAAPNVSPISNNKTINHNDISITKNSNVSMNINKQNADDSMFIPAVESLLDNSVAVASNISVNTTNNVIKSEQKIKPIKKRRSSIGFLPPPVETLDKSIDKDINTIDNVNNISNVTVTPARYNNNRNSIMASVFVLHF